MNLPMIFIACAVAALVLAYYKRKARAAARTAARAQLVALRCRRQMERLEMVLKQIAPELFAQVKARSDMEWQQAVKGLDEYALPTLYPLETAFTPIGPRQADMQQR